MTFFRDCDTWEVFESADRELSFGIMGIDMPLNGLERSRALAEPVKCVVVS